MKRRFVSLLLAACMVSSLLPSTAWATGGDTDTGASTGGEASGAIAAHKGCQASLAADWPVAADPAAPEETQEESGETPAPETDEGTVPAQEEAAGAAPAQTEESTPAEPASAQPQGKTRQAEVDSAVKVKSFTGLAAAVGNNNVTDIVLTTDQDDGKETWTWDKTIEISRTIHISVEKDKTITLKRDSKYADGVLFNVTNPGQLILGDGTISTKDEGALESGDYTVTQSGGELIIDGGAVWGTTSNGNSNSPFFINENGVREQRYNTGIAATASLINCPSGTLDIWGGVRLQNNQNNSPQDNSGKGSAIYMKNNDTLPIAAPTLNLYGGVVEWCATTNVDENGTGAIYCGKPVNWTEFNTSNQYGYINLYAGGVQHNANYDNNRVGDNAGDGTGIALDAATLNMYGGSVSYNCGDEKCSTNEAGQTAAADGGGIGGRVGSWVNLYGGKITHNWTGGFGGGVCLWNSKGKLTGAEITNNEAGYGGGIAIAGCEAQNPDQDSDKVFSKLTMTGGQIAYNEAKTRYDNTSTGVGGGICAGTSGRPNGSILDLQGGQITQNKAQNGGGVAAYAGLTTALKMSGTAEIVGNAAYDHGGGAYFTNHNMGYKDNGKYIHPLLEMSGAARIDTANTVYFENVIQNVIQAGEDANKKVQVPVQVTGALDSKGTVAIFEFSDKFWDAAEDNNTNYVKAAKDLEIVKFDSKLDIQENKFALDHDEWYLKAAEGSDENPGHLTLQQYTETKQYWIRNGTPVTVEVGGEEKQYYRIYDSLKDAFDEAANNDTLYIFYNATMKSVATVDGKHLTLLAESTSSAGVAGSTAGTCKMTEKTYDNASYYVMEGNFLRYGDSASSGTEKYTVEGKNATKSNEGKYTLNEYDYNVRNDYTVTLASNLSLSPTTDTNKADISAAIIVKNDGRLDFGQEAKDGMGYGSLVFDGNYSYPVDGPMLKVEEGAFATIHSGVTLTKHTNKSDETPGTVYNKGTFTMMDGATISKGVSPLAGAVYNKGIFNMKGGALTENTGAMPRYNAKEQTKAIEEGIDPLYHGQPKYYYGAGAVNVADGKFEMTGGTISGNRGEWGAVAGLGGELNLTGGTISGNAAVQGNGAATKNKAYDLTISGYSESEPTSTGCDNPGCGGGLYLAKDVKAKLGGVTITKNWSQENGGGLAQYGGEVTFTGPTAITNNTAGELTAGTILKGMGGGIFTSGNVNTNNALEIGNQLTLTGNKATIGGGLAAMGAADKKVTVTISSDVAGNTAVYGGGIYAGAYSEVTLESADLQDNTATYGGGAYIDCVKTTTTDTDQKTGVIDPKDEDLGTDVPDTFGQLTLKNARINNNHLTSGDNDTINGFGGGVYNRGILLLNQGAYASGNDRLYLEKGHVVELTKDYKGTNQTPENKLTINSRETALGTNIIQMADENQYGILLTKDKEKTAHYQGFPMALSSAQGESDIIELNYYTITYYDRLKNDGELGSHHVTDMVVPGQNYTILGWDTANQLKDEDGKTGVLQIEPGKSLGRWLMAEVDNGNVTLAPNSGSLTAGSTYNESKNLTLVADFTTNNYLAVTLNELDGAVEDGNPVKSEIGSVKLSADGLTSSSDGQQSYFSTGMKMSLNLNPVTDDKGHQKGILKSLTIYKSDRSAVNSNPDQEKGERVFGQFIYKPMADATFEKITLNGNLEYPTTGIPTGWKYRDGVTENDLTGKLGYDTTTDVLTYTGGTDNILIVAKFAPPAVELKMTAKDGENKTEPVLTEYYATMHQAFTRMANVMNDKTGEYKDKTWDTCTITPLTAGEDKKVYYYGVEDGVGSGITAPFADLPNNANVIFDLNGFTLDLQGMPQQTLSNYHLTLKNGGVTGGVATDSQFTVSGSGTMTLKDATLMEAAAENSYNVTVNGGTLEMDKDSHAGKVLLNGDNTCITALEHKDWPEYDASATGATPAATIYTDLGKLVTPATEGKPGKTGTRRVIYGDNDRAASNTGHNLRSHFALADSVTNDTNKDEAPNWFIGTDGFLYPRVKDVIPRLVCTVHSSGDNATDKDIRTETPTNVGNNKEYMGNGTYYPIYYIYERAYGYDNKTHPLAIDTVLKDAYGNPVNNANGVVTVTMAQVVDGVKNRVLTARVQFNSEASLYRYTGTDANPVFPASDQHIYYLTGSFTGGDEYAASYAKYWKVNDKERADNSASSISGLSELTIHQKEVSDPSVVITSVTPGTASYIGEAGQKGGNTSRGGTVRVRDNHTNLNLTSGDDLQVYYRKLTRENKGEANQAGEINGTTYYYADDIYYTATGSWYGVPMVDTEGKTEEQIKEAQEAWAKTHVQKIDGQDVGTYSVEVAAIEGQSVNYTGVSGWKGQVFTITPYTGRLNPEMTNNVVISDVASNPDAVKTAILGLINGTGTANGLKITDIYGNQLGTNNVTYTFVPADSNAKVGDNGLPCAEGLYTIEIHPYDGEHSTSATNALGIDLAADPNYSATATGHQALLITEKPLTMAIQTKNGEDAEWGTDPLNVPYNGNIYVDGDVKMYDETFEGSTGNSLRVVKKSESGDSTPERLNAAQYTLQVGLPDDPARDSGRHVLVATDSSGKYVAIGAIRIGQNGIDIVKVEPENGAIYTGKRIDPTLTVTGSGGKTLVEGRDYTVSMVRIEQDRTEVATNLILNAGTYKITVAGKGNYIGTRSVNFKVEPKDINNEDKDQVGGLEVKIDVSTYNLGITRPRAVLTYNGMMLSPGGDYVQTFLKEDGTAGNENNPDQIKFTGQGNYKGEVMVKVETLELPDGDLTITDSNNEYVYQATDLFGYLNFQDLTITEATKEANRLEPSFDDYEVKIASLEDYYKTSDGDDSTLVPAKYKILDMGGYVVKMTQEKDPNKFGYFFMRVTPRPVTVTVKDNSKIYGDDIPTFTYETNLSTLVGENERDGAAGEIGESGFFLYDEEKPENYPTGTLYRAEGEDVGNYYYSLNTFTAGPNYILTVSSDTMFAIHPKSLCKVEDDDPKPEQPADGIKVTCKNQVEYTGYPVTPLNSVTFETQLPNSLGTQTLHESRDYTLTYYKKTEGDTWTQLSAAPIAVGEYKVVITGMGNYTNQLEQTFSVVTAGKTLQVEIPDNQVTYKADAYRPKVTVKTEGGAALNSNNYSMTYSYTDTTGKTEQQNQPFASASTEFINAGTYTIHVNGTGNYAGAFGEATFTVKAKDLAEGNTDGGTTDVKVDPIAGKTYTGKAITFSGGLNDVTYAGLSTGGLTPHAELTYGTDYNLTYIDNTNAGTATAVLVGAGNYTGSRAVKFEIKPKDIYVAVENTVKTYGENDPEYSYKVYENASEGSSDYFTEYSGATITGKPGRVAGEEVKEGGYALNLKPEEGSTLSAGPNYTIHLKNSELKDNPVLTIQKKAIGTGNQTAAERIVATIAYVEAKDGATWPVPEVTYWKEKGSEKLDPNTHFTVKYYKQDGTEVGPNTAITQDSVGSYYAIVTAKGTNYSKSIKLPFMVVKEGSYLVLTANGSGVYNPDGGTATLRAMFGEKDVTSAASYTVICYPTAGSSQTIEVTKTNDIASFKTGDAGTYVIQAEYSDTVGDTPTAAFGSTTVVVTPKSIADNSVTIDPITEQLYTSDAVVPELTIKDGDKELVSGKDYTISVTGNVAPNSEATVTITGMGNYSETRNDVTFKIGPMQYTLEYNANGGNAEGLPKVAYSKDTFSVASGSGMTHENVALEGKENIPVFFVGWSQENNNGVIYKKGDNLPKMIYAGQTLEPTKTLTTLYAIWGYDTDGDGRADVVQSTVKVVYDKGVSTGGKPPEDDQTYLIGAMATALGKGSLTYEKDNVEYVFMGWTPTAQKEDHAVDNLSDYVKLGSVYATGASFYVGNPSNGAFTLYPVWGVDTNGNDTPDFLEGDILLIYDANGGVGAPPAQECQVGETTKLNDQTPTRDGAVFLGWTKERQSLLTETKHEGSYAAGSEYQIPPLGSGVKHTTLYALWAKDANGNGKPDYDDTKYKVQYNLNDGDGTVPTDTNIYLEGQTITLHNGAGLSKTDCTFAGWSLTKDGKTLGATYEIPNGEDNGNETKTLTFYAVWTAKNKVTLTYNKGSAKEDAPPSETAVPGTKVDLAGGLTREGYTFLGWTPNENEQSIDKAEGTISLSRLYTAGETLVLTENVTLSPVWIKTELLNTYRLVLYRAAGGDDSNIKDTAFLVVDGATATIIDGVPTREGYTFESWNTKADGTGETYQPGATFKITGNITLYAVWKANATYKVTYHANGGTGAAPTDATKYQANATVTVLGQGKLTREGYTFGGWNTKADGTGETYQPGATFTITGDTTLYAMWTANVAHTVTYDANDGTGTPPKDDKTYSPGETVTVKEATGLTKEGAQFAGWSTQPYKDTLTDLSKVEVLYGKGGTFLMGSKDVTLYAVWATPEAMSVFYKMNFDFTVAGSSTRDQIATLPSEMFFKPSSTVNIKALQPYDLKDGYVFCGWSENKDSTTTIQDPNITITKDTTLYAVFATKTCQVYTQAGTGGNITPSQEVAHGSDFTVTVTVNSGYQLDKVTVNGAEVTLDSTNSYTITNITKDTYVMVTFTKISSSKPTPTPDPDPKPVTPDDTGVSSILNTKDHDPFLFGYPNGTFGPERSITRAEVAQMFYNLLLKKDVPITVQFEDVPENAWYAQAVNTLASMGMINGVGSDRYEPERAITRAEFSAIATRFGKKTTAAKTTFVDVPESHWAYQYINVVASYGWVSGYGGNLFGPDDLITRAQAATMTNRMLGRLCDNDAIDRGEGRVFPDVTNAHWAWYQIAEATTEHDFTINKDYTAETWKK